MKRVVSVFVEGGREGRTEDSNFRRGWSTFLSELRSVAQANGYHTLGIVRGRGRQQTFDRFKNHKRRFPDNLCILLVDSETLAPPNIPVWEIVRNRTGDGWKRPSWATERHLYLMAHFVETWLLTDQDALRQFFKRDFDATGLPTTNLETRSKRDVEDALQRATKKCQRGQYQHGDAHEIIEVVRPERVKSLHHGKRLFEKMDELIRNVP